MNNTATARKNFDFDKFIDDVMPNRRNPLHRSISLWSHSDLSLY